MRLRELVEARIAADPVRFRRQAILIGIVFAAAASLGYWYSRRPRPNYLTVTGTAPAATRLEDILKPDAIRIDFGGSAARLEQIGKPVEKGITMTPRLIGTWNWNTDRQLIFSPMQDWAVGREYVVRFDKKLFPSHVRLEKYEYRFKSASFTGGITGTEFYIDPKNPKLKQVVATIAFSHPIETASLESRIQLQLAGQGGGFLGIGAKSYPYTLSYNKYKNEAYVRSENIEMPAKDTTMDIVVAEGVSAERGGPPTAGKSMAQVKIPGLYSFFHVDSVQPTLVRNERYEPEQVLVAKVTAGMSEVEAQKYLEVYLLPRDLPPIQGRAGQINHHWYDTHIIGPEVLSLSERVKLDPIATDKEYATLHSFKYKAEVGRFLYIRMRKGLESFGGYILAEEFDAIVRVPEFPKELNIMQDGAILSLSGDKKISVISRGIPAVRFELGRVLPGQINHLVSQSGGQFRSPTFNNENFGEENVSERFSLVRTLEQAEPGKTQYTAFDLSEYLTVAGDPDRKRGLFFFRVEGWDPVRKQPLGIDDRRLILVTDLGLLVKSSRDGSRDVFVASIHSGEPLAGVLVQVIGKNGLPVLSVSTDEEGRAHFPPLSDFKNERQPVVYIAHRGSDLSFIPYDWSERQLNLSRFDIGGVVTPQAGAGMDAYLFSDRGIYRPGDEFRIGLIVKAGDWRQSLAGVPLEAVITDARGLEIYKTRISLSGAAFEEIRYRTEETSPTGSYQVGIYIVKDGRRHNLLGSTHVRIEEFLPDRLRITAHLSEEREEGWVSPAKLSGKVTLKNLFGTPAANRRVAGSITLSPAYPGFKSYRDYTFYDPQHAKHSFTDRLPDGMTNADGEAELPLNLERFEKATYRLVFSAEGYESEGGRSVGAESAALVSNLDYLIGYKPDGELRYINKQSSRTIELIAVNAALQKIAVQELTVQLIEERYVSALIQQENGTYKYQSVLKEIPIRTQNLEVSAQGTRYALATGSPGDFALVIRGPDGTEFNRIKFSVVGRANLTRSLEKNAELQIKLNKDDYAPGEEIELEIKAPYVGAGLITIERDKVYAHKWFRSRTTSSIQRIRVPNSIEGNGYVNVSFMRAMDSPEIFMSPLSYGVASFSVSRARRTNVVTLESKDLAKPGEPYVIGYRTQKPGKIVIFAVDEGILQVAGYKTPDPLGYFFEKRALEVNTAQILDLILPEFSLVQALSAPGGDQGAAALGKNLNPFRRKREAPVACWSGIIDANEQAREYSCQIPDYFNGTVRVMAVAVSPDSIGVGEKKAVIRGPFVLTPNAPTFVAPGDEFTVSVGVANNVAGSGKQPELALELKASGHLEILDGASRTLQVGEAREGEALFRLRAKQSLGSANLAFTVRLGENVSRQSVDLSVRPPVPYMTTVAAGHMRADRVEVPVTRQMYPRYRTLEASASPLPLGMARGLIHYLANFPYACTEQLVSRAFPALVLRRRPEFGYSAGKADSSLQEVLRILRARQNAEGAFGFWAANSHVSDFQTVYALHFLTEAKDMGYPIPPDLLARGLGYLSDMLNRSADSLADLRVRAYAVYVLTRNGTVTTGFLNGLRAQLDGKFKKEWRRDLSGVYMAATYKLLKQDMQADGILRDLRLGDPQSADYDNYYDGLVRDAQLLFILAKHFPDRLEDLKGDELLAIVQPVIQGSYNTISSAYTILALSAYADAVGDPKPATLGIHEIDGAGKAKRLVPTGGLFPKTEFAQQAKAVRISNDDSHPLFYQVTQAGFDLAPPSQEIKQKLEIQREYRNLNGKVITEIPMGEEIEVRLKIRATEQRGCHNVAIVDLLPGGFDPVIQRTPPPSLPRPAVRSYSEDGEGESEEEMQESPVPAAADSGNWRPDYVDFREDRVVIFGSVGPSAQEYVYRIKAANQGTFSIPPVFGESMYDRTIQARGLGATMTVTGN
ncbi:MAG: alpha-2-macroglobulin [Elusimicrobiota bacterium]